LEILLSPNAGSIGGTVLDVEGERPVSGVTVVLVPREESRMQSETLYRTTISGAAGAFTFASLAPGRYTAMAFEGIEYGAWFSPEFMAPLLSKGETVEVREKSGNNLQLKTIRIP